MSKRSWVIAGLWHSPSRASAWRTRDVWSPYGAVAQAPRQQAAAAPRGPGRGRKAVKKSVPVRIEALGTVTPMASVAIKARVESEIVGVHFDRRRRGEAGRPPVHARQPRDRGADPPGRGGARPRQGAARAGRARPAALHRTGREERDHAGHPQQCRAPRSTCCARRRSNAAILENLQRPARLPHDPRADLRPHQRGHREGRQLRAAGRLRRRSRPSTRPRRSTSRSRCRSASLAEVRGRSMAGTAQGRSDDPGRRTARDRARGDDREYASISRPAW